MEMGESANMATTFSRRLFKYGVAKGSNASFRTASRRVRGTNSDLQAFTIGDSQFGP